MISFCRKDLRITNVSERVPIGTFLNSYFSGSIFPVSWVTFDPTSCKYADHQNTWIVKDSPRVYLGPFFGCHRGSLFIKSWVPIGSLFLSSYFFHCRSILKSPLFSLALGCSYLELWEQSTYCKSLPWKEHLLIVQLLGQSQHVVNLKSWEMLINSSQSLVILRSFLRWRCQWASIENFVFLFFSPENFAPRDVPS